MSVFSEIDSCRICGQCDLVTILDLGEHALSGRFPDHSEPDPPIVPLVLVKCNDLENSSACGLLQLKHTVMKSELFLHNYGYRSGLNTTMTNHLNSIVAEIQKRIQLHSDDLVLDIGSNDGTLLRGYKGFNFTRVGIDPAGEQFRSYYNDGLTLITDCFDGDVYRKMFGDKKAKVITSIAMFYDLDEPMKFMTDIASILDTDGIWVTEQSYVVSMMDKNSFDTICHEHLEYYSYKQIEWMANRVGLKIVDATRNNCNGGSFRVTLTHIANNTLSPISGNLSQFIELEQRLGLNTLIPYQEFEQRCIQIKAQLTRFILEQHRMGKTIYLYGASTKGNTLLQYCQFDNKIIKAAAERNVEKYGRVTPKTRIPMIPEKEMRAQHPDYLLVLPWHFRDEFLVRERDYLERGGQYIFPLPRPEVVSGKKKVLITGITGQIGTYLTNIIKQKGQAVIYGIVHDTNVQSDEALDPDVCYFRGNLFDSSSILDIIKICRPDEIYHLAGQTDAVVSIREPLETVSINGNFVLSLCETIRQMNDYEGHRIKLFLANSSELYKGITDEQQSQITETNIAFYPKNPYALGKLLAYWAVRYYRETYGLFMVNGIVFNTESPLRRPKYVTRKVTQAVAKLKLDPQAPPLKLGNLDTERDWVHASDVADGIYLTLQQSEADDYVLSSGQRHNLRELVEKVFELVDLGLIWTGARNSINEIGLDRNKRVCVEIAPEFYRSYEHKTVCLVGDNSKLRSLGWVPKYTFDGLLKEMVEADLASLNNTD